jgi:predicted RNA-binding protein
MMKHECDVAHEPILKEKSRIYGRFTGIDLEKGQIQLELRFN